MFVRFECGCLGIHLGERSAPWELRSCESREYRLNPSPTHSTTRLKPLSPVEVRDVLREVQPLLEEAHKFRAVLSLLGLPATHAQWTAADRKTSGNAA